MVSQSYIIKSDKIKLLASNNYPIHIDTASLLDIKKLTRQDLKSLFVSSVKELSKYKPASFWFAIDLEKAVPQSIIQVYFPNAEKVNAYKLTSDSIPENIAVSRLRNDFYIINPGKRNNLILINIQTKGISP
ncbi:MAG: hypothetical protein HC831_31250 [Chloroflexia bacterium]|nr:hypothetical protein [Chloroflexia bacterium]